MYLVKQYNILIIFNLLLKIYIMKNIIFTPTFCIAPNYTFQMIEVIKCKKIFLSFEDV